MFDNPREVEIQWTYEEAVSQCCDESDSEDEDSISNLDWEIGQSRDTIEINSWDEIPEGYELANQQDVEEYENYISGEDS